MIGWMMTSVNRHSHTRLAMMEWKVYAGRGGGEIFSTNFHHFRQDEHDISQVVSTIHYSTMNPKPDMIALSCAVQKELQRVAAAASYNAITQKFPTKIEKQRVLMGSYFHGGGETISSQAEQLVEGEEGTIYHSLYKSFTEISVDRNDATNAMQKRLKKTFSPRLRRALLKTFLLAKVILTMVTSNFLLGQ